MASDPRPPGPLSGVPPRAVGLLSGGMDSATCLAIARRDGYDCHALSFDYGQRHGAELQAASRLAVRVGAIEHRVQPIGLGALGGSALTDRTIAVPQAAGDGIPLTYVPARNTVFLACALAWAEVLDAEAIEMKALKEAKNKFRASLSYDGKSWLRDP